MRFNTEKRAKSAVRKYLVENVHCPGFAALLKSLEVDFFDGGHGCDDEVTITLVAGVGSTTTDSMTNVIAQVRFEGIDSKLTRYRMVGMTVQVKTTNREIVKF